MHNMGKAKILLRMEISIAASVVKSEECRRQFCKSTVLWSTDIWDFYGVQDNV